MSGRIWRYELTARAGGGYTARRCLVAAPEPVGWLLRLEIPSDTPKGLVSVLIMALGRAIARDGATERLTTTHREEKHGTDVSAKTVH